MHPSANVLLALLVVAVTACATAQEPPTSITIEKNRATVRGVVQQNVKRCEVDGPCYLVLSADGADVRVYYHHGESPACANRDSTRTGLGIATGDTIEAVGLHSISNRVHLVDVCCPECQLTITRRP